MLKKEVKSEPKHLESETQLFAKALSLLIIPTPLIEPISALREMVPLEELSRQHLGKLLWVFS